MDPLLKKNQKVLLTIKRLGINGEGIGYYKRQAVFVDGVLPPEEVIVKITDVKNNFAKGEVVKINIRANKRVKPFCRHYGECGGCQIQHIAYEEQLALKEEMLHQTIERYSGLDVSKIKFNDMVGMNHPKHYRYKAQMPVKNTDYGVVTGLYRKESNDLVEINDCPIQNENINRINEEVTEICNRHDIRAFDSKTMRGLLRYIVVRAANFSEEVQVTLVVTIFNHALKRAARDIMKIPGVVGVGISKNKDAKNVEIFGDEVEILEGNRHITEGIGNIRYHLQPKAFYQLNPEQAIKLYSEVKSHLDFAKDRVIVDGYCGAGAITMLVAKEAEKVLGIDISRESIYSAKHNAKINNFSNVKFHQGEVSFVLPRYFDNGFDPDVIIFDPPRSGIDEKTLDLLCRKVIDKIIYISCNPSTLAKNLKILSRKYDVESVSPYDMFPHTSHIESITVLRKKK